MLADMVMAMTFESSRTEPVASYSLAQEQGYQLFSVVYFCRGALPKKRVKGHYWGKFNKSCALTLVSKLGGRTPKNG